MVYECTDYDYFKRVFLVGSNASFAFIPIYCILLTYRHKMRFYTLLPEIFFSSMTCLWSTLYHLCDAGPGCSKTCVTTWDILYKLDFIFSYQIIQVVFSYSTDHILTPFKLIYLGATFVMNIIFINTYHGGEFENYFYVMIFVLGIITTLLRLVYLHRKARFTHYMTHHFDIRAGIPALICTCLGFAAKVGTPNNFYYYWWGHSLWHIFIGMGIYFAFNMYDITPLLCCLQKKECTVCR